MHTLLPTSWAAVPCWLLAKVVLAVVVVATVDVVDVCAVAPRPWSTQAPTWVPQPPTLLVVVVPLESVTLRC